MTRDEQIQQISRVANSFNIGPAPYMKMLDDGEDFEQIIAKIEEVAVQTVVENNKRKAELSAIAASKGLEAKIYLEMIDKGYSASIVHEKILADAKKMSENSQDDIGGVLDDKSINNITQGQNATEGNSEPQTAQAKRWRITCKMTFSDKEQAQAFGEWMKSNDVDYEKVTKWEQC